MRDGYLVLEDGTAFPGRAVGAPGVAAGEACFTTAMTGYEEAATDPSYVGQVLCFAYPLVGNYGVDRNRIESERVQAEGIVMRKARPAFAAWLREEGVVGLEEVDTRALVRRIRDQGVLRCALGEATVDELQALALARAADRRQPAAESGGHARAVQRSAPGPRLALIDLGCKRSIPRRLAAAGLEVVVVPGHWDADAVLETRPRAVLVGNGPGDPAVLSSAGRDSASSSSAACRSSESASATSSSGSRSGMRTFKLPFGHRGANHPVRDLDSGRILVTVQNHGYAVATDDHELVTHVSLNDGTIEGLAGEDFTTVQFHPEAAPGPLDALPFFDRIAETCRSAPIFAQS